MTIISAYSIFSHVIFIVALRINPETYYFQLETLIYIVWKVAIFMVFGTFVARILYVGDFCS